MAVDLRSEFHAHFLSPLLITLARSVLGTAGKTSDVQRLEDVFTTVSYLLKYLLR